MDKVEAHKAVTFQAVNLEEACRSVFHQEGRGGLGLLSGSGTVLYLFQQRPRFNTGNIFFF